MRIAVVLDVVAYLAFVGIQVVPGPVGLGLWLTWPVVVIWALADVAAWEGSRGGLTARAAFGAVVALVAAGPVVRWLFVVGPFRHGRSDDPVFAWWCVGALVVAVVGLAACLNALQRRRAAVAAPSGDLALPSPWCGETGAAPRPVPSAPAARPPSRAARVLGAFGFVWIAAGMVEAVRGIFWFGFVEAAIGVGWFLCHDTLLDRRTERRLVRTDRASLWPVLLVPPLGLALLVRAAWLLGRR